MGIYSAENFYKSIDERIKQKEELEEKIVFEIEDDDNLDESGTIQISNKYNKISKYKLCIMNDEGKNMPHFHVVKGITTICYICLDIPIYFDHGNGVGNPLKSKESEQLYEFMKSIYIKTNKSVYATLCDQWNDSNSKFSFPDEVPNYSELDPFITSKTIDVDKYRRLGKVIYKK